MYLGSKPMPACQRPVIPPVDRCAADVGAAGISFAQTDLREEKEREYDSVYVAIYELLDEAKFTEAHDFTVKACTPTATTSRLCAALYLALSDVERITGNTELAFTHIRNAEGVIHSVGEDYWNLKKTRPTNAWRTCILKRASTTRHLCTPQEAMAAARRCNPAQSLNMQMQNLPIVGHHYLLQGNYALAEKIYMQLLELNISGGLSLREFESVREVGRNQNLPIPTQGGPSRMWKRHT